MTYTIGEFSKLTNLSVHTLRYYEHEGLMLPERSAANRRCYSDRDLEWAGFIQRLKETGMAIKEIKRYAILRSAGEKTVAERLLILTQHRQTLTVQLSDLQTHLAKLEEKIAYYEQSLLKSKK